MATYYVDPVNGADGSADPTSENTPLRTFKLGRQLLSASDTLTIVNASATTPIRENHVSSTTSTDYDHLLNQVATYQGSGTAHIVLSHNLTEGESAEDFIPAKMDQWIDGTTLYLWSLAAGADLATLETTTVPSGQGKAVRIERLVGGGSQILLQNVRGCGSNFRLMVRYQDENASSQLKVRFRDMGGTNYDYNASTEAWEPTTTVNNLAPVQTGSFGWYTIDGAMLPGERNLEFRLTSNELNNGSIVADVRLYFYDGTAPADTTAVPTNSWTQNLSATNGNVYEITTGEPYMVFTCSSSAWASKGVTALRHLGEPAQTLQGGIATYADVLSTPNSWCWDGTNTLRINLGTETIDSTHVEACYRYLNTHFRTSAAATIKNMWIGGHHQECIVDSTCSIDNVEFSLGWVNVQFTGTNTSTCTGCVVNHSLKDGLVANGAGVSIKLKQFTTHDCNDEGAQAIGGGGVTVESGYGYDCGHSFFSGNGAFGAEETGSTLKLYNVTTTGCYAAGVHFTGGGTAPDLANCVVYNVICYGNNTNQGSSGDISAGGAAFTGTATNVHFGSQETLFGLTDGVNGCVELSATPFTTAPQLRQGAEAVGAGSRWWTGVSPVGVDGEPFADFDTDVGGVQSKYGPFHPVNLGVKK